MKKQTKKVIKMTVIDNILNKLVDFIGDIFFAILIIFRIAVK